MQLEPRLSDREARLLAVEFRPEDPAPAFKPLIGLDGLRGFQEWCAESTDSHQGVWVWPDGIACPVPHPHGGQTQQDVLAHMYQVTRDYMERIVLQQMPAAGQA